MQVPMTDEQWERYLGARTSPPPVVGYFLHLELLDMRYALPNSIPIWRWIEHNVIAYEFVGEAVEIQLPMGGKWKSLSPYIQFATRKEMMKRKDELNREIVRKNEPHNWIGWGISEEE